MPKPLREIVLDTETTGLDPAKGDRMVEIGCIELINHMPSGTTFQRYLNPERDMPAAAFAVHGLSNEFLAGKPLFAEVADDFFGFVGSDPLIIHNAAFDLGFIDAELVRLGRPPLARDAVVDTLLIARRKFPGAPASLDALCRRFAVDSSTRDVHGALLDAQLLAEVYLALIGGRQPGLGLNADDGGAVVQPAAAGASAETGSHARPPRPHAPDPAEIEAHTMFIDGLKDPLWRR